MSTISQTGGGKKNNIFYFSCSQVKPWLHRLQKKIIIVLCVSITMYCIFKVWRSRCIPIKALSPPISHISKVGLNYSHQMKYCQCEEPRIPGCSSFDSGSHLQWLKTLLQPPLAQTRYKRHLLAKGSSISILRVVLCNRVCLLRGRLRRHLHTCMYMQEPMQLIEMHKTTRLLKQSKTDKT